MITLLLALLQNDEIRQWAFFAEASSQYGDANWSASQATGAPNTEAAGDLPTAWAPRAPDGGEEWLDVTYERPVVPTLVRIHETFNPGAIVRIESGGATLWKGDVRTEADIRWLEIELEGSAPVRTLRIVLDTTLRAGWSEIDAVELVGRPAGGDDGGETIRQWAIAARASSQFGDGANSAHQAVGPPDTELVGDWPTAWASLAADGGRESLEVQFERAVVPTMLRIHETHNPGAVVRVESGGAVLWEGDTRAPDVAIRWLEVPLTSATPIDRVTIILDTTLRAGWNEIDAVELVGRPAGGDDGGETIRQWAIAARASSQYTDGANSAQQAVGPPDTETAGDRPTAWASLAPDGGIESLEVRFERAVVPTMLRIHETYNPGAVMRVESGGAVLWEGDTRTDVEIRWLEIPLSCTTPVDRLTIVLDTARRDGWNEIDAVELVGREP